MSRDSLSSLYFLYFNDSINKSRSYQSQSRPSKTDQGGVERKTKLVVIRGNLSQKEGDEDQEKSGEVINNHLVISWSDLHNVGFEDVDRNVQMEGD